MRMVVDRGRETREQGGTMSIRKHKSVVFRTMCVDMNAAKLITEPCLRESVTNTLWDFGVCQDLNSRRYR
jgi:hypothetical protein